jgi:hypothetical protein
MLLIDGIPGAGVDGMGWWWPPGVRLIDGIMGAGVDGMGWWPGGGLFEVVKLKAASTTVSPAAAHAAATARRRKGRRVGSVIENLLPAIIRGGRRCAAVGENQSHKPARQLGWRLPRDACRTITRTAARSGKDCRHDARYDSGVIWTTSKSQTKAAFPT